MPQRDPYRNTALLPQILGTMCVMTPVSVWAVTKLHKLVTQPCLEEELSAARLTISGVPIG